MQSTLSIAQGSSHSGSHVGSTSQTVPKTLSRRPWTLREDQALRAAMAKYNIKTPTDSCWSQVRVEVGNGRTSKDCRKRWYQTLDPQLKKGRWTEADDAALRAAYAELGPRWKDIASRVPGRNAEQVAKRWRDVLSPDIKLDAPWTAVEDTLLLELFEKHGAKWTYLSDFVPGRNGIACRNRFRKFRKPPSGAGTTSILDIIGTSNAAGSSSSDCGSTKAATKPSFTFPGCQRRTHIFSPPPDSYPIEGIAQLDYLGTSQNAVLAEDAGSYAGLLDIDAHNDMDFFPSFATASSALPTAVNGTIGDLAESHIQASSFSFRHRDSFREDSFLDDLLAESSQIDQHWANFPVQPPQETSTSDSNFASDASASECALLLPSEPIRNVWALLVALEGGSQTLNLTSGLVRQLLADASK